MTETMREWRSAGPGPIGKTLKLIEDAPRPPKTLKDGQILVKVLCAGLNPADHKSMELGVASRAITSFPKVPGMDLCGKVLEAAADVSDTKAGDLVIARLAPGQKAGSLAEYAALDRDGYVSLPQDFDPVQAAGAATAAMTAYETISPHVKEGDKVFINGGSGGVGTFGIQIAKALGCHVTVTCSTAKAELCKKLGADEILDYKTTDIIAELAKKGQVFHLAVDNISNSPPNLYSSCHHFLIPNAKFILVGGAVSFSSATSIARSILLPSFLGGGKRKLVIFLVKNNRTDLEHITKWLVEGKIKTVVDSTYSFKETPEAFEHLKKGSCAGKVVVRVSEN